MYSNVDNKKDKLITNTSLLHTAEIPLGSYRLHEQNTFSLHNHAE